MIESPLVSFIIPYYNAGLTIKETVNSILNQTYKNIEIWIVNDGSQDQHSLEILTLFEGIPTIHIIHQENAGPSVARNNALKQCRGEIIVPLDADDLIAQNTLDIALPILLKNPENGVVYGDLELFGSQKTIKKQVDFNLNRQLVFNQIAVCALIKKNVFETCGFYDEFLSKPGLEDWEFWLRVGLSKWKLVKCDSVFFHIRVSQASRTYQVANKNIEMICEYVFKKHAASIFKIYNDLFYQHKMLKETPDYKIGHLILKPWRFVKSTLKK